MRMMVNNLGWKFRNCGNIRLLVLIAAMLVATIFLARSSQLLLLRSGAGFFTLSFTERLLEPREQTRGLSFWLVSLENQANMELQ